MTSISRLPLPLMDSYEWQFDGACNDADSEIFFSPEHERGRKRAEREAQAKAYCHACPVVKQCLEHALAVREPFGVWGGLNTGERTALLRGTARRAS